MLPLPKHIMFRTAGYDEQLLTSAVTAKCTCCDFTYRPELKLMQVQEPDTASPLNDILSNAICFSDLLIYIQYMQYSYTMCMWRKNEDACRDLDHCFISRIKSNYSNISQVLVLWVGKLKQFLGELC